jgi:FixJ family two-component response regulator
MTTQSAIVYVVDDDQLVCKATARLLKSVGMQVRTFTSAREFLDAPRDDRPGCLLVDVRMPGLSGLDLQQALRDENVDLPVVFMTGHGDIPMSVRAMKAGAVDFLPKPVNDQDLLDAVGQALDRSVQLRRTHQELAAVRQRIESLSPREREVMELVVAGKLTKQIARRLGIAEPTVKTHRRNVMEKMAAESIAELSRMAEKVGFADLPDASVH